jgi:hypothetical protein
LKEHVGWRQDDLEVVDRRGVERAQPLEDIRAVGEATTADGPTKATKEPNISVDDEVTVEAAELSKLGGAIKVSKDRYLLSPLILRRA